MQRHAITTLATLALAFSTGCSSAMNPTTDTRTASDTRDEQPMWEWPLRFTSHSFSAGCFDVQSCTFTYAGLPYGGDRPWPSVASYGRPFEKLFDSLHHGIRNFPPPAKITWRSKDGTPLYAEVDMAEIFRDQLIRHNLRREEIANTTNMFSTDIILEVNDRTINVYMRAHISTKELQEPGNPYSNFRDDLIKVYSRTY